MERIAPANLTQCYFCQDSLDATANGIFQWVSGWVEQRAQGGSNAIALPKRENRYACNYCIARLRRGIPIGQMHLFDNE
jgi:hypothetical protein